MKRMSWVRAKWHELAPWIAVICVAITVHWFASSLHHDVLQPLFTMGDAHGGHEAAKGAWGFLLFSLFWLFLAIGWLYRVRSGIFRPRTRFLQDVDKPEGREHLILFLSELNTQSGGYQDGVPEWISLSRDLEHDLSILEQQKRANRPRRWNWEMPLQAIRHHKLREKTLRAVTIVCSPQSIQQVHLFHNILTRYPSLADLHIRVFVQRSHHRPEIIACPDRNPLEKEGGWEFERFDKLSLAVQKLLDMLRKGEKVKEEQIMIDFTGGQKVTSVVAAAATFNRKIKAQYVQTNDPWDVVSYDIVQGSSETGGMEI